MLTYYVPPYHFEHYPEGLKGRYVASPSTAALLGRCRIFSSRSEYTYWVSVDRKYRRRRRALEVASRAVGRESQGTQAVLPSECDDDVEDAARFRRRVWSGIDPAEVRSATPRFLVNIRRARCGSRLTWAAVRPCIRTEEESAETIARIVHWQSMSTLTADRELSYAGIVEAPEADSDVWVKVEYDEPDLFASPPPRSGSQSPASPGVRILSRRPSFFADSPRPSSQLLASPSNVRVRVESEELQLSSLAPASPLRIKSESHSTDDLVLLGQQSQADTFFSPVSHATYPVHPRPVAQPKVKSEDDDESIHLLLSSLCQITSPQAIRSLDPPVVTPPQWRAAPRQGPSPRPIVPFWARTSQDVIMREAPEDSLRARVVEPLHPRAGPVFSSFSAFAAATSPQVAQGTPASRLPLIRIESHSDEDLAGLRRWHDGESSSGTGPATANAAPAHQLPQPPATTASLFGDDLDDYEDEPTVRATEPAPQPPAAPASLFGGDDLDDYEDEPTIQATQPAPQPASPLFGGDDGDEDEDEPTIVAVKPAPQPRGRKAHEAAQVQVKREPTEADIDALLDEIFEENQAIHRSPPAEQPQVHVPPQVIVPLVHCQTGCLPSPPIRDVEMDTSQVHTPYDAAPASQSRQPPATPESPFGGDDLDDNEDEPTILAVDTAPQPPANPASRLFGGNDSDEDEDEPTITAVKPAPKPRGRKACEAAKVQEIKREPTEADIDALLDEIFQENQAIHCLPPAELPQAYPVSQVPAPLVVHRPADHLPSPPIQDVEMDTSQVYHPRLPHVSQAMIQPLHIHDSTTTSTTARPQAREARSPHIVDVKMEEAVQVVHWQVTQPLRWSKKTSGPPVQAEPMETSPAFDGGDEEEDELWRELHAMKRDPDEWFRQPLPPAPTPAAVKTEPAASVSAALVNVRVESVPSIGLFDSSPAPAVVGLLVKTESVGAALADLAFSLDCASDEGSTSGDADICSLIESLARLSIGSRLEALSPSPLESSDSVVSYLDAGDCADLPSFESAAQEDLIAMSSGAAPLVKEEPVEVLLSTPILASNAPVVCQSPVKRIINSVECDEEVHVSHTGQQSSALLLRAAKETSGCPLDDDPGASLPHPSAALVSESLVDDTNKAKNESNLAASPSVFAAFLQRCTDAFHAQHSHESEACPSEEAAIEIYELYEALPAHVVCNVKVQSTTSRLASSRSAGTRSSTAKHHAAPEDKSSQPPATASKPPPALAAVLPSHSQCPPVPSRRPRTDEKSNTADAVQGGGAPSSSLCLGSRDLKQRARESFLEYWNRGCVQELGDILSVGEDGKLGFEVDEGECLRPVGLSSGELDYCEGPSSLGAVPAPSAPSASDKNGLATGLALATLAPALAPSTADKNTHSDTVLACSADPAFAPVLAGTIDGDHDDSGSDTIKAGNSDEETDPWHCPVSRSDKGKECLILDAPADDRRKDDLELFDAVYLQPEDYDVLSAVSESKLLLSPRSRHPPIRLRLPKSHRQVPPPASGPTPSTPRPRASVPRAASRAASIIKRCLGLKTR